MARPSALYQSTSARSKYKFPVLEISELVELYQTMQFDITESQLVKPTSRFMSALVEQIMDKFLYISPYAIRKKVEMSESDHDDIKPALNTVICQRIMYKFLCDCGIDDFSIRDVSKPESSRVRIILSGLVNYARFREERMSDCDELLNNNNNLLIQYKNLLTVNKDYDDRINQLREQFNKDGVNIDEVNKENQELENKLISLKTLQEEITSAHSLYREEKSKLVKELENQSAIYIETEKELEQIRPYIKESPESIKELIEKMKESKDRENLNLESLTKRSREISTSVQSFQVVHQDFNGLVGLLEEVNEEANKHKNYNDKLKLLKEEINQTQEEMNELTRRINQIENQLKHNEERVVKLKSFYNEKLDSINAKIKQQMAQFAELKLRRNTEEIDIVEKEVQTNNWQKQINDLNKTWESECRESTFMLEKLNNQVNTYLIEMTNAINEATKLL